MRPGNVTMQNSGPAHRLAVHFSNATDEWETPRALFDRLNALYRFTLDVCATAANAKCRRFYSKEQDGLSRPWAGICWMNPPYGRQVGLWVRKAYEAAVAGATVVCLLPARVDTAWFHDYCIKGAVQFVRGRLKFGDAKNSAPFPSMIVAFEGSGAKEATWRTI